MRKEETLTSSRNLGNPLFDQWLAAVTPYYQREHLYYKSRSLGWEIPWDLRNATSDLQGVVQQAVQEAPPLPGDERDIAALTSPWVARHELVRTHAWAIPTERAIDAIVKHSPAGVVEIGAGGGYWARMLRERGLLVMAYDEEEVHNVVRSRGSWSPVDVGGPEKAALWPQLTLFLCWPPYDTPMALMSLLAYKGDKFVYVGEGYGGCTGDDAFHALLEKEWREIEDDGVWLPQWPGIHDTLYVYERKKKRSRNLRAKGDT